MIRIMTREFENPTYARGIGVTDFQKKIVWCRPAVKSIEQNKERKGPRKCKQYKKELKDNLKK